MLARSFGALFQVSVHQPYDDGSIADGRGDFFGHPLGGQYHGHLLRAPPGAMHCSQPSGLRVKSRTWSGWLHRR